MLTRFVIPGEYTENEARKMASKIEKYGKKYWILRTCGDEQGQRRMKITVSIILEDKYYTRTDFISEVILALSKGE